MILAWVGLDFVSGLYHMKVFSSQRMIWVLPEFVILYIVRNKLYILVCLTVSKDRIPSHIGKLNSEEFSTALSPSEPECNRYSLILIILSGNAN